MTARHPNLFFLFVCLVAFAAGCTPGAGSSEEYEVYYFPEKNAYYDLRTTSYYYSLDSARSWDSLKYQGSDYGAALGAKVALDNQPLLPFANNDSHRKTYNGILLNLVNSRTRLLAREDSLKRLKPAPMVKVKEIREESQEESEERPKKGIKKFFDKIFGKKKDKKTE